MSDPGASGGPGAPGDPRDAGPAGHGAAPRGRIAVIGDIGGHLAELRAELVRLGADSGTWALPPDLTVVQVGDLVHRGPDSDGVVALVDHLIATQPAQWVQLVGNHEAQYLREPAFQWPERIGEAAALTLWDLWSSGRLHAAVAIEAAGEPWLVTHAGLTAGFWREVLDAPTDAALAARALDGLRRGHETVLFHAGTVLGGGPADLMAGPTWASAGEELIPSWLAEPDPPPFHQVHGHSAMTNWRRGRLHAAPEVAAITRIDRARAHETSEVRGRRIVGIDARHGAKPHRPWEAFVLADAIVTSRVPTSEW